MKEQLIYKNLAKYYDLIYSGKDYSEESKKIIELTEKYKITKGKELLEVACGTGHHLEYLKKNTTVQDLTITKEC